MSVSAPESDAWTLRRLLDVVRRFWLGILLAGIFGGVVAFGASALQTPVYQSTSSLFFALNQGTSASDLNQGSTYTQDQMLSFAQLASSSRVLSPVIEDLGLDSTPRELVRSIEVTIPQSTVILRVTAMSTDRQGAADLADAVADELTTAVVDVAPKGPEGAPTITAEKIDDAVVPQFQSSPNKPRDALIGGIAGGTLGIALALMVSVLDNRVRTEEILGTVSGAPVLGVVTRSSLFARGGLGVAKEPMGHSAEEFRRVRSALTYASINSEVGTLLVTSTSPGEGKTTVATNLALTLADLQHNVLLVDADLRRPRVHQYTGIESSVGLTSVLVGEVEFDVAKYPIAGTTLDVLASGVLPPNPAEMLTSRTIGELLQTVAERYEFVVIDSPPVLSVADANLLAPQVDGVIVVADAVRTRRAPLAKGVKTLEGGGARILGTVLNRARREKHHNNYYGESGSRDADPAHAGRRKLRVG